MRPTSRHLVPTAAMTTAASRVPPSIALPCKNSWLMSGLARSTSWWSIRSIASPARLPTSPLACRLRQVGRVVRSTWGIVRVDHPGVQHHFQHGPAHAQRAALLCPVRARGDRRAGVRQDRGLQTQGPQRRRHLPLFVSAVAVSRSGFMLHGNKTLTFIVMCALR
jgi:hypothetical protein